MAVYSSFLSSLTHFSIYVMQTALLYVLFLCLYKIYILNHFKIIDIDIAVFSKYRINIVSKLES